MSTMELELVFGLLTVCGTILGCTWKISGKISCMETSLKVNTTRTEDMHTLLTDHARECDMHRVRLESELHAQGSRLAGLEQARS